MTTAKTYTKVEINTEKAILYGENGSASYYINDCGGLEIIDVIDGEITEKELSEAQELINSENK